MMIISYRGLRSSNRGKINSLSHIALDYVAKEKWHKFFGEEEDDRGVMGFTSLLFLFF